MSDKTVETVLRASAESHAYAPGETAFDKLKLQSTLWPNIRTIIETNIAESPRQLQKAIGPSELGTNCLSCLAKKLAGWQRRHSSASWLPFIGTCVHEHMERLFDGLNPQAPDSEATARPYESEMRVRVGRLEGLAGGYDVYGSIDLYDRRNSATIDWKVVGGTTLKEVKANGPSQQYLIQASLYAIGLLNAGERVERSCIYFLPRNGISLADAFPVEMTFDPRPGRWALSRAQTLVTFMDLIEQQEGVEVRDEWIRGLPHSQTHCFGCGTWPDDLSAKLPVPQRQQRDVPDRWNNLYPLLDPVFPSANITEQPGKEQ